MEHTCVAQTGNVLCRLRTDATYHLMVRIETYARTLLTIAEPSDSTDWLLTIADHVMVRIGTYEQMLLPSLITFKLYIMHFFQN